MDNVLYTGGFWLCRWHSTINIHSSASAEQQKDNMDKTMNLVQINIKRTESRLPVKIEYQNLSDIQVFTYPSQKINIRGTDNHRDIHIITRKVGPAFSKSRNISKYL